MSLEQLERDVAELKVQVAALLARLPTPAADAPDGLRSWERSRPPLTPEQLEAHLEMEAYGRYYRQTGKDPPQDWKPGDPIPEADEEWCPR